MSGPSHSSTLTPRAGFHPTLRTTISSLKPLGLNSSSKVKAADAPPSSSSSSCSLHILYSLSPSVILDQYQLRQLHNEGRLVTTQRTPEASTSAAAAAAQEERKPGRPISAELYLGGQLDLEAPVSRVDPVQNAYAILSIPLTAPLQNATQLPEGYEIPAVNVDVELPLHLRYQEPVISRWLSKKGREGYGGSWWMKWPQPDERMDIVNVQVDWPCVFWACDTEQPEAEAGERLGFVQLWSQLIFEYDSRLVLRQDGQLLPLYRPSTGRAALIFAERIAVPPRHNAQAPLSAALHILAAYSTGRARWTLVRLGAYGRAGRPLARQLAKFGSDLAQLCSYRMDYDEGQTQVGKRGSR